MRCGQAWRACFDHEAQPAERTPRAGSKRAAAQAGNHYFRHRDPCWPPFWHDTDCGHSPERCRHRAGFGARTGRGSRCRLLVCGTLLHRLVYPRVRHTRLVYAQSTGLCPELLGCRRPAGDCAHLHRFFVSGGGASGGHPSTQSAQGFPGFPAGEPVFRAQWNSRRTAQHLQIDFCFSGDGDAGRRGLCLHHLCHRRSSARIHQHSSEYLLGSRHHHHRRLRWFSASDGSWAIRRRFRHAGGLLHHRRADRNHYAQALGAHQRAAGGTTDTTLELPGLREAGTCSGGTVLPTLRRRTRCAERHTGASAARCLINPHHSLATASTGQNAWARRLGYPCPDPRWNNWGGTAATSSLSPAMATWITPASAWRSSVGYLKRKASGWVCSRSLTGSPLNPSPRLVDPTCFSASPRATWIPWSTITPRIGNAAMTMPIPPAISRANALTGPSPSTASDWKRRIAMCRSSSAGSRPVCAALPTTITGVIGWNVRCCSTAGPIC